jgi:hypothetical protein
LKINFRAHRRRRGAAKSNYNLTKITRSNLTRRFRYDKCNNLHVRNNSAPDSLLSMFVFLRSLLDCRLRGLKRNKSLQQLRHTFMCGCCLRTRFLRGRTPPSDAVRFFFHVCPPDRALRLLSVCLDLEIFYKILGQSRYNVPKIRLKNHVRRTD